LRAKRLPEVQLGDAFCGYASFCIAIKKLVGNMGLHKYGKLGNDRLKQDIGQNKQVVLADDKETRSQLFKLSIINIDKGIIARFYDNAFYELRKDSNLNLAQEVLGHLACLFPKNLRGNELTQELFGCNAQELHENPRKCSLITAKGYLVVELLKWGLLSEQSAIDEATKRSLADKEKTDRSNNNLKKQANSFGFQCHNVAPDGNCFFNAVVDQLKRMDTVAYQTITSQQLREMAVQHLLDHFGSYKESIDEDPNVFMGKIIQGGEWADHVIIQALSRALNVTFVLILSNSADPTIVRRNDSARTIYLGYEVGWHYQSLIVDTALNPTKNIRDFIQRTGIDTFKSTAMQPESAQFSAVSASATMSTAAAITTTSNQANLARKQGVFTGKVELPSQEEIQLNYALAESRALGVTSNDDDDVQQQEDGKSFGSGN
jgi:hypothetical protein